MASVVGKSCVELARSLILSSRDERRLLTCVTSVETASIFLLKFLFWIAMLLSMAFLIVVTVPSQLDCSSEPSCAGEIENRYLSSSSFELRTMMT